MKYDFLAIDGMNLLHRARWGGRDLTTKIEGKSVPIGGTFQFLRSCVLLHDEYAHRDTLFVVAWEGDRETSWRRDLFAPYKDREKDPDIESQHDLLRKILVRCGWAQMWSPTFEADDTLATLAARLSNRGMTVGIVTGDHDLHQCITETVHVIDANGKRYDLVNNAWRLRDVRHHWKVEPDKIPDVKALMGDKSDNVPGATGIGKLWATGIIQAYDLTPTGFTATRALSTSLPPGGELEIEVDGKVKRSKTKAASLIAELEQIMMFRKIVTVDTDAPIELAPRAYDAKDVRQLFIDLRFSSLLAPSTLRTVARIAGVGAGS